MYVCMYVFIYLLFYVIFYLWIHIYIYPYPYIYISISIYIYIPKYSPFSDPNAVSSGLLSELRSEGLTVALRPRLSAAHGEAQKGLSSGAREKINMRCSQPVGKVIAKMKIVVIKAVEVEPCQSNIVFKCV